ncbi:hypothetical protein [Nitrosomonas marina]|uniref:Uncharacterized protein n=1 Tax=Nitrosomonas marina TaxID=917 RepID=A0A1H8DVI2_9PROT|nr:hypothetical protein [Nitrosomonas marina]SEN11213.1 hypothetical protein SAMN05216325_1081 [Nitrosomonas marina]
MLTVKLFDMHLQNMEVNGQEILTKDKISMRINLSASRQIANNDHDDIQVDIKGRFLNVSDLSKTILKETGKENVH